MKCANTLSGQNAECLNVKSDGTYIWRSDFMRLCVEGVPVTPGQREGACLVTNRNTTRHFVVAGRQRSVSGHAMESLTQVRYGMWFLLQFPYVDRTTYIPSLNLTSETQKHVLLWTWLTFITDSEQDTGSNHD
jgi:hypothetical protein